MRDVRRSVALGRMTGVSLAILLDACLGVLPGRTKTEQYEREATMPSEAPICRPWIGSRALPAFADRERGQTTTEYAIMLGFLAIALIIALLFLRDVIRELFSDAASSVSHAPG